MDVLFPYTVADANLISSNVPETDYAEWSAATYYAVAARVIRAATHSVYERLVDGTSSGAPEDDKANWVRVGPTNRWAMFDQSVGSITTKASPLTVQINVGGPVDDLVLLNVTGTTVGVTLPDATRSVSVPAPAASGAGSTVVIEGLASAGGIMTLTVTGTGTVGIGTYAAGNFVSIGTAQLGTQLGITDYSKKDFDEFGNLDIVRRDFSRRLTVPLYLASASLDQVVRILAALRSTAVIWRGVPWLASTLIYGFAKDWSFKLDATGVQTGVGRASGSVSLESLTMGLQ